MLILDFHKGKREIDIRVSEDEMYRIARATALLEDATEFADELCSLLKNEDSFEFDEEAIKRKVLYKSSGGR